MAWHGALLEVAGEAHEGSPIKRVMMTQTLVDVDDDMVDLRACGRHS